MLGLEKGFVRLVPYNPAWQEMFANEKARLQAAIGGFILDIQHVGSTAIPGCLAKPIIDFAIAVKDLDQIETCVPLSLRGTLLEGLGCSYHGENGIPGRHYFQYRNPLTLFHLHMSTPDHANWVNHIRFRDYLRSHPEAVEAYSALKQVLVAQVTYDRVADTEGKTDFILNILEKANETNPLALRLPL
jgi:GrpB-like predicted nucleotidyltransferase (UPF0157 family)